MSRMETREPTLGDVFRYNLCTFYLLPFCDVNIHSFSEPNLVNSWVHPEGKFMYVRVKDLEWCQPECWESKFFKGMDENDCFMFGYHFPLWARPAFVKYKEGRYSEIPTKLKDKVKKTSGLDFMVKDNTYPSGFRTDVRIGALDKEIEVKKFLEAVLETRIDPKGEYMAPPGEKDYLII